MESKSLNILAAFKKVKIYLFGKRERGVSSIYKEPIQENEKPLTDKQIAGTEKQGPLFRNINIV